MFSLIVPGKELATVKWTGKSISINRRSTIGRKITKTGKKIPIIIKSNEYRDFCESIAMMFLSQWGKPKLSEKLFMVYYVGPHLWNGKQKDSDAFHKPLQDGLTIGGVIEDDSQILGYCMLPLDPNESMDYVSVTLYMMNDHKDYSVGKHKERIDF